MISDERDIDSDTDNQRQQHHDRTTSNVGITVPQTGILAQTILLNCLEFNLLVLSFPNCFKRMALFKITN